MKSLINILLWVIMLSFVSCSDIFEESIDDKQVYIIAPGDSIESPVYGVTFWWNPLDGALKYNLQIVAPDFNNIAVIVLDTMVSSTKFTYTMDPGVYQWRIRAENGSTKTPYSTRVITVNKSGLSFQTVYSISPTTGNFLNSRSVPFTWQSLYGAIGYTLEIDTTTGDFSNPLKYNTSLNKNTYTFNSDGSFYWRVKATDSTQESKYSSVKVFTVDTKKPDAVTKISSGTTKPILLKWDKSISADVALYKLYVYESDGFSVYSNSYPQIINSGTSFSFNENISDRTLMWRVTAVDKAGNESSYSPYGSFNTGF